MPEFVSHRPRVRPGRVDRCSSLGASRSSCAHSMTSSSISRAPAASRHGMPWNAVFGSGRPSRIALPIPPVTGAVERPMQSFPSHPPTFERHGSGANRWWNRCAGQFFRCRGHRCGGWRRCSAVTGRVHPNSRTCSPHDLRRCGPDRGPPWGDSSTGTAPARPCCSI